MVVVDGKRYAVLVREFHDWVARIDLDKVDAISPANPTALSAAELAPAVTYLDLTRAP